MKDIIHCRNNGRYKLQYGMWQLYKFQKVMKVTGEQHMLCFNIKIQQFSTIKHLPISLLTFISHTASIHLPSLICPKTSTWRWVIICLVTINTFTYTQLCMQIQDQIKYTDHADFTHWYWFAFNISKCSWL